MTAAATPTPVVPEAALQEAGCGPVPEPAGDGPLAPALATPEPFAAGGWYDDLPVVGKLPPEQAAAKLRDIVEDGTAEVEQFAVASESFALTGWPWSNQAQPWQHTAPRLRLHRPAPPARPSC